MWPETIIQKPQLCPVWGSRYGSGLGAQHQNGHADSGSTRQATFKTLTDAPVQSFFDNSYLVVILHPYILHASSQDVLGVPRLITNPPVILKDPLNFNRPNPDDFSLLERATLHYLGVDRLDFQPTAPREVTWWAI